MVNCATFLHRYALYSIKKGIYLGIIKEYSFLVTQQ